MSQQQTQYRPSGVNGVIRRRMERDFVNRGETYRAEFQGLKSLTSIRSGSSVSNAGVGGRHLYSHANNDMAGHITGSRSSGERGETLGLGGLDRPLHDRLLFMTACLIGHPVEVQVKNGSIYAGIFHTANAEKDYGIVLKMARLTKDGFVKEGKSETLKDATRKAPVKTLIIHAKDLVQIIAKDVPLSGDSLLNGHSRENRTDILTDANLSQSRHLELERELKPWTPDKDDPKDLGLDSTFQNTWNRNWDQFETNKALFGVESTFDEEIYTTKLERGPQMRELEREAWRIAREIEGETTTNFHLAEERGSRLPEGLEAVDEESRYSSVIRQNLVDNGEDNEDGNVDMHNEETFGASIASSGAEQAIPIDTKMYMPSESGSKKSWPQSADSNQVIGSPYHSPVGRSSPLITSLVGEPTSIQALNLEPGRLQVTEDIYREFNEFKQQENAKRGKKQREEQLNELKSFSQSLRDLTKDMEPHSPKSSGATQESLLTTVGGCAPPASALPIPVVFGGSITSVAEMASYALTQSPPTALTSSLESTKLLTGNSVEWRSVVMAPVVTQLHPPCTSVLVSLPSSSSDMPANVSNSVSTSSSTAPMISSPASSLTSSTSTTSAKKSNFDLNAKEFKLNPNAKVFTPSIASIRSSASVVQSPIYMQGAIPLAPMQSISVGIGVNPLMQQPGQSGKYAQLNSLPVSASTPFLQTPVTYTPGVSGGIMPPSLPGQSTMKTHPHVQQPMSGHSFISQQPIRFTSQGPPVQPAPAYLHPNGQLYSQQMMFGQPGQVLYIQPFPQEVIQGPPIPPHQPAQPTTQ
eukprot:c25304_g2_i1 orf=1-2427(-)